MSPLLSGTDSIFSTATLPRLGGPVPSSKSTAYPSCLRAPTQAELVLGWHRRREHQEKLGRRTDDVHVEHPAPN